MGSNAPRVMIIAGEASGDLYGAHIASGLKEAMPGVDIRGVGGRRMRQAGVELVCDSSTWSAIGIAESIKVVPRLLLSLRKIKQYVETHSPDLIIPIDFGAFNVRLIARVPSATRVLYFIPPGSWRRDAGYESLKNAVDRVVTPFPWSAETLAGMGVQADFFGHPLLDVVNPSMERDEFFRRFSLFPTAPLVALLPGSRAQEIRHNVPALAASARRLAEMIPDIQFAIPLASSIDPETVRSHLQSRSNASLKIAVLPGMSYDLFSYSRAAIVTSGTATMEAAILGCPMVIIYGSSWVTALEYRLLGRYIKYIGLPNIILDREACPELIGEKSSPENIAGHVALLVADTPERETMLNDLAEVRRNLGGPGAVSKTVEVAVSMLQDSRRQG